MHAFADLLESLRRQVDERLASCLSDADHQAHTRAREALPMMGQVRELTMRGGKRLRPALVLAAVECLTPWEHCTRAVVDISAAIELLQTYLLIHDDWMDGDTIRRGGPTVHVALGATYNDAHRGNAAAILAGDMASSLAQGLVCTDAVPAERLHAVLRAYAEMQRDVVLGQTLDLLDAPDIDAVHDLKTTSYTVRGPLALGHAIAGGDAASWVALEGFARPIGLAFQLRDDLIGTFGDAKETGKTAGSDLRAGKRTAPVKEALARLDPEGRRELESLLGAESPEALQRARSLIEGVGAVTVLEARIAELRATALAALDIPGLRPEGCRLLGYLASVLTDRRK